MSARRYGDDEVREIFDLATAGGAARDPHDSLVPVESDGLTLEELQRIGQEAGIEPTRVAHAASQLEARGRAKPVRRSFGMPVGVSRMVDLPRAPSEHEWEQLIAICRSTFGSQGVATTSGSLRDWSNGNLHVSVEPTESGFRLRLTTLNELGMVFNGFGALLAVMATIMGIAVYAAGKPEKALSVMAVFGGMAVAALGANLIRLPGWARRRAAQMEALAEQVVKLLSNPSDRSA